MSSSLLCKGRYEDGNQTGDLDVFNDGTLTIRGKGAGTTILDGAALADRIFHVLSGGNLILEDLSVAKR